MKFSLTVLFGESERNEQEEHTAIAFENFEIYYYVWFACFLQYSTDGRLSSDFEVNESIEFHYHNLLESKNVLHQLWASWDKIWAIFPKSHIFNEFLFECLVLFVKLIENMS